MRFGFVDENGFRRQFFQHFNAALRLFGFAGFVAETVDEFLQVFAGFFGFFGLFLFVFALQSPRLFKRAVVAAVADDFQPFDMQNVVAQVIQQRTVVADDDQRSRIARQIVFKPQRRFQIQVVGRFVQQ